MSDGGRDLGGVTPEEIEALYRDTCAPPGIANSSPLGRFSILVANVVGLRKQAQEKGQYAVFLLSTRVRDYKSWYTENPRPFLAHGNEPILDKVWISSAPLADARVVNIEEGDIGAVFTKLENSELSLLPAILIDWTDGAPKAQLYYEGLERSDKVVPMDLSGNPITPDKMKDALDHEYFARFRSPHLIQEGGAAKIWARASNGIPQERVEGRIQGRLMDSLQNRFPRHNLRGEHNVESGRVDIVVWIKTTDSHGNPVCRNEWVLELKVLREKAATGELVPTSSYKTALQDGLNQSISYRSDLNALQAALCCWDLRKDLVPDSKCFKCVAVDAKNYKIHLWRWYLYRSAKAAREGTMYGGRA